jgi:hypothetical protein
VNELQYKEYNFKGDSFLALLALSLARQIGEARDKKGGDGTRAISREMKNRG